MLSLDSSLIMCSTPITCKAFYISRYYTNITLSTMSRTRRALVFHFIFKHAKKEKHFKAPLVLASALFPTKWAGIRRVHGQGTVDTGTTCSLKHQQKGTRQAHVWGNSTAAEPLELLCSIPREGRNYHKAIFISPDSMINTIQFSKYFIALYLWERKS